MSIRDLLNSCENHTKLHSSFTLSWSMQCMGWGQISFYVDDDKNLKCENEMLSKDDIKQILNMMVDNCTLED